MQCVDDQTLASMSLGLLSAKAEVEVRTHTEECPTCRIRLSKAITQSESLRGEDVTPIVGPPVDPDLLKPGEKLGRYFVLQQLGMGGMGAIYAAYDPQLDRKIALKLLRANSADADGSQGPARLMREAQAIARISHPNVVTVFDVGTIDSRVFVAMEFVDGGTLRQWVTREKRPWREILQVYRAAGQGLAAAHEAGLVHRDFKPDNVLVSKDGRVRVTDFGVARLATAGEEDKSAIVFDKLLTDSSRHLSTTLTQHGQVVGTIAYMAPEQFKGERPDSRSDQFSFCVALHESLYGSRPYAARQLASDPNSAVLFPPPKEARVPARIHKALARGLSLEPKRRFASMNELIRALDIEPRNRNRATVVLAVAFLVSGIAGHWYHEHNQRLLCGGAETQLASVWDGPKKQAISAAFLATQLPYADATLHTVSRLLDDYARRWVAMATDACEATRLRGEQSEESLDLRMSCLSQRREELKALSGIFGRADKEVVENAAAGAQRLSPVEDCANLTLLRLPVKPPVDPAAKAKVEEVRLKLSRVKVLSYSGKYGEALPLAQRAVAESEKLGYRPLEAESLFELGSTLKDNGSFVESERTLIKAEVAAEGSRHDEIVARARTSLISVSGRLRKHDQEELWIKFAFAAIERTGGNDGLLFELENVLGIGSRIHEKYDEALDHYRRALSLAERANDSRQIERVTNNIGNVMLRQGKYDEALPYYERSLRLTEQTFGPTHPHAATTLSNIGVLMRARGRDDEALAYFRRSLEIGKLSLRVDHPSLGLDYSHIGSIFLLQHKYDEALQWFDRAHTVAEKAFGPNHPDLARELVGMANAHLGLGQPAVALPMLKRALAIYEAKEPTTFLAAEAKFAFARALVGLKQDPKRARVLAEEARNTLKGAPSAKRSLTEVEEWLVTEFPPESSKGFQPKAGP